MAESGPQKDDLVFVELEDDMGDDFLREIDFNLIPSQSCQSNRFRKVTPEEVTQFLDEQQNKNTKIKTETDVKIFQLFLKEQMGEVRPMENIPPEELSLKIGNFLLSVKKKDGSEYEPTSLRSFFASFERHLKKQDYGVSLTTDIKFSNCREILKAKTKQLKSTENPKAVINSLWKVFTTQFGMRTGKETHECKWGDVEVGQDQNGDKFLTLTQERQTKTRTGTDPRNIRKVKPRAYAIPDDPQRCPVAVYHHYASQRPANMMDPGSPFFLSINHAPRPGQPAFKSQPMGINKLYGIMNDMKENLDSKGKKLTPYSSRKYMMQTLNDEGVPANMIMQISGHKNIQSMNNYSKLNNEQMKSISSILSGSRRPSQAALPVVSTKPATMTSSSSAAAGPVLPSISPTSQDVVPRNKPLFSSQQQVEQRHSLSSFLAGNSLNAQSITININQLHPRDQSGPNEKNAPKWKRIRCIQDSDSD